MRRQQGFTVIEIIAVIVIIGIVIACSVPAFAAYRRHTSLVAQADQMRSIFRAVRSRAITHNANAGVKFALRGQRWTYALYDDGNANGIRTADINSGIDRCYASPSVVMPEFPFATIGVLPVTIRDPDGDPLAPTASPVQFGTSSICSFSSTG